MPSLCKVPKVGVALLAFGLVFLSPAGAVLAQKPKASEAAQTAFDNGMALMKKGDYVRACPLLERSVKLDPAMAASFRWAECLEKIGKLASAWRQFTAVASAARAAGMRDRETVASERAAALDPRLSRLLIVVPDEVADLPDAKIARNGAVVPRELWDEAVPVDEGNHALIVTASGKEVWVSVVMVQGEGTTTTASVPVLAGAPNQSADKASTEAGGSWAVTGIVVAAVGAAVMGAGGIVALTAEASYEESALHCVDNYCDQEGLEIRSDAITQAHIATAIFLGGAAILVGGGIIWLTAPSESGPSGSSTRAALRVAFSPTGVSLMGSW